MAEKSSRPKGGRRKKRSLASGQIHVRATFNNTIITVTDHQGNTVCWSSPGAVGLRGSRRSTAFAARLASEDAVKKAMGMGVGLSICHGIVEDHKGMIMAENVPDGGAQFTISLPVI